MKKAKVTLIRLNAPHQSESFQKFLPLGEPMRREIDSAVRSLFDAAGGTSMLKSSGDVYIKPNGIDAKPYAFTRPELVESVVRYWKNAGAKNVYLLESSTQGNFTRLVFDITGYTAICKATGTKPVFLDEDRAATFEFKGKPSSGEDERGYEGTTFRISKTVAEKLVRDADQNLYISLPKLKTHSMAGVTLGVKNQWAFPMQEDRRKDHNFNLANKLVDVLGYLKPDYTIIEGVEGTIHGHYPVTAFADACVVPFGILIGSDNVVAADLVGARVFGLGLEDVEHLRVAIERGYSGGVRTLEDIDIAGDLSPYTEKYPWDLRQVFPDDIAILRGTERLCREGCMNNPLSLLQAFYYDYGGKGGWTMVMGKGHEEEAVDAIKGRVLVVGKCAIKEVGDRLVKRLGANNVYFSGACNDLTATLAAMCHLMKVSPFAFAPYPFMKSAKCLLLALAHGTSARVPSLVSNIIKTV